MGQYHKLVNFTRKEFVNPHMFGNGLKLGEQVGWTHAFSNITHYLLASCSGRGGGDFQTTEGYVGLWGGDRVALVGDYAQQDDFAFLTNHQFIEMMESVWGHTPTDIYAPDDVGNIKSVQVRDSRGRFTSRMKEVPLTMKKRQAYEDISDKLVPEIEAEFGIKYVGLDGWRDIRDLK